MTTRPPPANRRADFTKLTIGDRLRYLMEVREKTQVALAKEIGLTQAAISNLVTDSSRKPSAPTLLKIAAALECNPGWIMTGEGDPFSWAPVTADAEVELLRAFKNLDDAGKAQIMGIVKLLATK